MPKWKGICLLLAIYATCLQGAEKFNFLLIVSDDLRDAVGCYGNSAVKTPNIDRLAQRGVRFDRAYVQYPVCNPSRTSFLTGMRPEQTHVVDNSTFFRSQLPDVVTLPQALREGGWHTESYGKIFHTGNTMEAVREAWMDAGKSWDNAKYPEVTAAGNTIEGRNLTNGKLKWCEWGAAEGSDDEQPDGQTAKLSMEAMERLSPKDKPWMICAGFHRPHDPFIVPARYMAMYTTESLKLHRDPADATPLRPLSIGGGATQEAFDKFTDEERREFLRAYYAGVTFMDAQVGRLMDTMDCLKLWENTVVIFMGDHGYHLNERNWWNKATLFERSCRVPFIVIAPDGKRGEVCRGLVELVDLYPTLVDYAGLSSPQNLAGTSLRPQLQNPGAKGREAACTFVSRGQHYGQAIRTDRWRFIQWSDGSVELYDEDKDPQEMHDVSGNPSNAAVITQLRNQLKSRAGDYVSQETSQTRTRTRAKTVKSESHTTAGRL